MRPNEKGRDGGDRATLETPYAGDYTRKAPQVTRLEAAINERPIAVVKNYRSRVTEVRQVTFNELAARLSTSKIGAKEGTGWVPADIEPGPRTAERVKAVSYLVLDVEADAEAVKDETGTPLNDKHGDIIKRVIGPEPPDVDDMLAELAVQGWRCRAGGASCIPPTPIAPSIPAIG